MHAKCATCVMPVRLNLQEAEWQEGNPAWVRSCWKPQLISNTHLLYRSAHLLDPLLMRSVKFAFRFPDSRFDSQCPCAQDGLSLQSATSSAALRRRMMCAQLGIGDCNGKQLLRVLNRFGFSRSEVVAALAVVDEAQQSVQQQDP